MKTKTTISIDPEILQKAKDRYINVSGIAEKALRDKVNGSIEDPEERRVCNRCGKQADIWVCPYEVWMCNSCHNGEIKKIKIGLLARN